ncbi:uncharacterized protein AB675_7894 [Cyphellophora attinorum]|uniref:Uncharacterized protein n=1 Tax=Cyphellophora attinorum TaxID=1664694 RepID=A0A0N0NN88_9EURO|nr:uncharacterized protein AB675_7894 [Phialophora attinorum]KPI41341.1 hypothetical protein AB675_7894 [Phialophora attinorum]
MASTLPTLPANGMEGAGYVWVLEHLLAYPGTYEIPLRTMYTLNCSTATPPSQSSSPKLSGNAFATPTSSSQEDQNKITQTAAAQLKASLMQHITQLPHQPTSLPPSFITSFVRRCFPENVEGVDFAQTLTALDYLKDLEVRRRREVVAALDKLGISRDDICQRETLAKKYPGVMQWIEGIEDKERKVESLYTQVYLGIRRWAMINELSLVPFNKVNCIAMLNTLYPPSMVHPATFIQPTVQLTATVLSTQRQGFFRYINGVEKTGAGILRRLMEEHKREGELTGWPVVRETLDNYLRMANSIIEESFEVTGNCVSPTTSDFEHKVEEDVRRKVDSGISFGSSNSSNRNSAQSEKSHATRPSTSSSLSTHSRKASNDKPVDDDDDVTLTGKTPGTTLERIARELRRMKSSKSVRDAGASRIASVNLEPADVAIPATPTEPNAPATGRPRGLSIKRSLRNMRSKTALRVEEPSRPSSRIEGDQQGAIPAFDAEEMRRRRMIWEAQHTKKNSEGMF